MTAAAIASQSGRPTTSTTTDTKRSNARLTTQSIPMNAGGCSSKSGTPWPGHELRALRQELGRLRGDAHPHAAPVSIRDDLDQLPLAEAGVGDDQLVHARLVEDGREIVQVAEDGQVDAVARGRERADELVVDPVPRRAERPVEVVDLLGRAGEERVPPRAERAQQVLA